MNTTSSTIAKFKVQLVGEPEAVYGITLSQEKKIQAGSASNTIRSVDYNKA